MSEKKFRKGSEEWMMFTDYWQLCQKYWEPEENDEYWEKVIRDTNDFIKKYDTKFARGIGMALLDSLEERLKGRRV